MRLQPRHGALAALTRRGFALLPFAMAGAAASASRAAELSTLPLPASLAAELRLALRQGKPLVVMASLHGCPFCNVVRDSYLRPLRRDTGQPLVQLDMGSTQSVLDFDGLRKSHDDVLRAWQVKVAPTVLFFGRSGREVAQRLVGASIPDFYGSYLDERLRTARRNLG